MLAALLALALAAEISPERLIAEAGTYPSANERAVEADGYRFTRDVFTEIGRAIRAHPGVARIEEIGTTVRGQPIRAVHVADPGHPIERRVLIFAGIHALEWISTETATDLLLELIALPPRGVAVTVIPILNPDGRARVEQNLLNGENLYQRGNDRFVDLNRDFAQQREVRAVWSKLIPGYYAVADETPLSQPESQALDALAARIHYDRAASLHAFGGYLYHPWAGAWRRTEDHAAFVAMGRQMEAAQGGHAYRTRQLSRWGFFFRAHGTELDHLYGTYGTQSWLIELTRSGFDARHPWHSWKTYFRWYNPVHPEAHTRRGVSALRELIRWNGPDSQLAPPRAPRTPNPIGGG